MQKNITMKEQMRFLTDAVASLYGRNSLFEVIKEISKEVFIPITLAGGLRNLTDVERH